MKRTLAIAIALGATVGATGLAVAQPVYGPNGTYYYPSYAAPPPPAVTVYPSTAPYPYGYGYYGSSDTHTGGGASRAYPYGGGPKPN